MTQNMKKSYKGIFITKLYLYTIKAHVKQIILYYFTAAYVDDPDPLTNLRNIDFSRTSKTIKWSILNLSVGINLPSIGLS